MDNIIIKRIDDNLAYGFLILFIWLLIVAVGIGIDDHQIHKENKLIIEQNKQIIELIQSNHQSYEENS